MQNGDDTVAIRVRTLRERRGWSQNQLAQRADIGSSTVSRIEAGVIASPGFDILRKISIALGVSLGEITGERPAPRRRVEISEAVARLPMRRVRVQADGHPTWDDTADTVITSAFGVAGRRNVFAAQVTGRCMFPHIEPGDVILIDPDQRPQNGDMVVVTGETGETIVKWYRLDDDGQPFLRAADGVELRPNGARIDGVVFRVERLVTRDPEA